MLMVATMKETGKIALLTEKAYTIVPSAESPTLENGKKIACTDSELKVGLTPQNSKETTSLARKTVLGITSG